MTLAEKVAVAGAIFVGVGVLVAIWQVLVTQANERKRSQPVVITHEDRPRSFERNKSGWKVLAHATNEGEGAAYNVRWGVSFNQVRFAFRLDEGDPYSGNRHRVLQPGASVPPDGSWPIVIPSVELWAGNGVPEESAVYWARYENAQGRTWQTFNPPGRSANVRIKRVRFVRLREWWESRKRRREGEKGREFESRALAELREELDRQRALKR